MKEQTNYDYEKYVQIAQMAKMGWWESDLKNKEYICSDFIVDLLGLESNRISFTEFHQRIREDHRLRLKMNICLFLIWRHTNKCSQSGQKTGKYGCTLRLISKSPIKRDIGT